MKLARSLFSLLCAGALSAPSVSAQSSPSDGVQPTLAVAVGVGAVSLGVSGPQSPFVGAVILSLSPNQTHYLQGLPPLLTDFAVLGVGFAEQTYKATIPVANVPPGLFIYAQGVVLQDVILATDVGSFVLDAEWPGQQ